MCRDESAGAAGAARPALPECETLSEVRLSAAQLLEALRALHGAGAAHGALSPEGVRLADGRLSIVSSVSVEGGAQCENGDSRQFVTSPLAQQPTECYPGTPPACVRRSDGRPDPRLWYRPPEEQVRSIAQCLCGDVEHEHAHPHSHTGPAPAADVWAAGCMIAEMAIGGQPLFEACQTEFELLGAHCDILGFEFRSDEIEVGPAEDRDEDTPTLRQMVPGLCDCGHDLLARLMCCDWRERITAAQALEHPFFTFCECEAPVSPQPSLALSSSASTVPDVDDDVVYESFVDRIAAASDAREAALPAELSALIEEQRGRKRARASSPPPPSDAKRRCRTLAPRSGEICPPLCE